MRSLSKLLPGVHPKLPGDSQRNVQKIYEHCEEHHQQINLYVQGEEEIEPEPDEMEHPVSAAGEAPESGRPGS